MRHQAKQNEDGETPSSPIQNKKALRPRKDRVGLFRESRNSSGGLVLVDHAFGRSLVEVSDGGFRRRLDV